MTVSCELPEPPVTVDGANDQVACSAVSPSSEREMSPANPPCELATTEYATAPPAAVEADEGATATPKSGGGETTSVALTVWVSEPLDPVMVNG